MTMTGSLGKVRCLVVSVSGVTGEPSFWLAKWIVNQISTASASEKTLSKKSWKIRWRRKAII